LPDGSGGPGYWTFIVFRFTSTFRPWGGARRLISYFGPDGLSFIISFFRSLIADISFRTKGPAQNSCVRPTFQTVQRRIKSSDSDPRRKCGLAGRGKVGCVRRTGKPRTVRTRGAVVLVRQIKSAVRAGSTYHACSASTPVWSFQGSLPCGPNNTGPSIPVSAKKGAECRCGLRSARREIKKYFR